MWSGEARASQLALYRADELFAPVTQAFADASNALSDASDSASQTWNIFQTRIDEISDEMFDPMSASRDDVMSHLNDIQERAQQAGHRLQPFGDNLVQLYKLSSPEDFVETAKREYELYEADAKTLYVALYYDQEGKAPPDDLLPNVFDRAASAWQTMTGNEEELAPLKHKTSIQSAYATEGTLSVLEKLHDQGYDAKDAQTMYERISDEAEGGNWDNVSAAWKEDYLFTDIFNASKERLSDLGDRISHSHYINWSSLVDLFESTAVNVSGLSELESAITRTYTPNDFIVALRDTYADDGLTVPEAQILTAKLFLDYTGADSIPSNFLTTPIPEKDVMSMITTAEATELAIKAGLVGAGVAAAAAGGAYLKNHVFFAEEGEHGKSEKKHKTEQFFEPWHALTGWWDGSKETRSEGGQKKSRVKKRKA